MVGVRWWSKGIKLPASLCSDLFFYLPVLACPDFVGGVGVRDMIGIRRWQCVVEVDVGDMVGVRRWS